MSTEIPATVSAATVTSWSDEVDVLVIGFGIGGGCAAVSAAAAGARVLVLERAAVAGGTTSLAGGHFYLGGGTAVQQATGHQDSPDEMYKYLVAVSREPDHAKIRASLLVRATFFTRGDLISAWRYARIFTGGRLRLAVPNSSAI